MRIDRYQPCPCGSGKKIKFCCSDIIDDLTQVIRMLDGDQRSAALERLNQAIAKHGNRPGLLSMKSFVQMQLKQMDDVESTIRTFKSEVPNNPAAHALEAMVHCARRQRGEAVAALQRAIELTEDDVSMQVYEAIGTVGDMFLTTGNVLAARAHYFMQAAMSEEEESEAAIKILRMQNANDVPLLFKDDQTLAEYPSSSPWKDAGNEAVQWEEQGAWLRALDNLKRILAEHPAEKSVQKNIAILESWLGDTEAAVAAYRRYSLHGELPLEEAVEAEAMAQLLDTNVRQQNYDVLRVVYPIKNGQTENLQETLISDARMQSVPVDPSAMEDHEKGDPPPRAIFRFLDRPLATSGRELTLQTVSSMIAVVILYGKQTDREARVEVVITRSDDFTENLNQLLDICGDHMEAAQHEAVDRQIPVLQYKMALNWVIPDDTPERVRQDLLRKQRRRNLLEIWPDQPNAVLGNKSANDVCRDESFRIPLLANILLMEMSMDRVDDDFDYNELRTKLGLPTLDPIDPEVDSIKGLPMIRLHRVDVSKLTDNQLMTLYTRAAFRGARRALVGLTNEVIARESLDGKINKADAYATLARISNSSDQSLEHISKAISVAKQNGYPIGGYLISELEIRIERRELDRARQLVDTIQSHHLNDPAVAQAFYALMTRHGAVHPEQAHLERLRQMKMAEQQQAPPVDQAADTGSAIWTPDGRKQTPVGASQSEEKPTIWMPGMD